MRLSRIFTFALIALGCALSGSDLVDWVTTSIALSAGQTAIAVVTGVAYEATGTLALWKKCRAHDDDGRRLITPYECATQVQTMILRWGIELVALGKITGWYKRDGESSINYGGVPITPITTFQVDKLSTRDGQNDILHFNVGNNTFKHHSFAYNNVSSDHYSLSLVGYQKNNQSLPVLALETYENGVIVSPFDLEHNYKRDGVESDYYVSGSGSVVAECQYGAGESVDFIEVYDDILRRGATELTRFQYRVFHGFIGSDSRMKCALKTYDNDQNYGSWRSWDDVWTAF